MDFDDILRISKEKEARKVKVGDRIIMDGKFMKVAEIKFEYSKKIFLDDSGKEIMRGFLDSPILVGN